MIPIIVLTSLLVFFAFGPALHAQEVSVGLGTADDFAVLAGETITNTGPTTITGDVGLDPGTAVTGFDEVTLNGELHLDDAIAEQAKIDLVTAYDDAASRTATTVATELGGQTLTEGAYDSAAGTFGITGTLTLDAQDDPNAVFIFQMASTLDTAAASSVNLINGAQACNVFWQVGSSATLGATSSLAGNILALTSITVGNGATVEGRALARNGSVTLDTDTITRAVCTAAAPEDTTTTTTLAPEDTTTTLAPEDTTTTLAPEDTTTTLAPGDTTASTVSGDTTASTTPGDVTASGTATNLAAPVGGVGTGGGSTSGLPNMILLLGGFSLLAVAVGAFVVRRRIQNRQSG